MNILYLHTHDMGRFNQMYGQPIKTPCFQEIAEQGILFRNAYCAGPTCSPSRAALLTGQVPHSAGMYGLANMGFSIADPTQHLSAYLKQNGFDTALCGVQHEVPDVESLSYDLVRVPEGRFAEQDWKTAENAADYLYSHRGDRPFFLSVGFLLPHRPFLDPLEKSVQRQLLLPAGLPETKEIREDFSGYVASVQFADSCASVVWNALKDSGYADDTLVILTTDHGIAFPRMKCTLYDTGIGVSLAMVVPGMRRGEVSNSLVSQIDIFPTICELLSIPIPQWVQGKSLAPILNHPEEEIQDYIVSEINYHVSYAPARCIRSKRYKYIRSFYEYPTLIRTNVDHGASKDYWLSAGADQIPLAKEELYDLILDPTEHDNVVGKEYYAKILQDMRAKLDHWMKETADPLLIGDISLPQGAITLSQEARDA